MFPAIQPTGLSYFSWKKNSVLSPGVKRLFYTSWEDALWDVLSRTIKQNDIILVPEFFCMDVIENMKEHGYRVAFYPVGPDLQTILSDFIESINRFHPAVIILFHPVGITNTLLQKYPEWKKCVSPHTIIVEDCVHRIIDPKSISFVSTRHILIDSLRKVTPVQGSNLYGSKELLHFTQSPVKHTLRYHITIYLLFIIFQIALLLRMNRYAEQIMILTYEVIGDSKVGSKGNWLFRIAAEHIDVHKIERTKYQQVQLYDVYLHTYSVPFSKDDAPKLRAYPILVPYERKYTYIAKLRSEDFVTRLELEGSPWTHRHGILFLPLGPHVNKKEQMNIIRLIQSHFTSSL